MEYAKYLGMDVRKDQKFFHIAKEGLKAPLPDKWKPYKNSKGDIYYINIGTNEAVYEHPCDEHYRKIFQQCKAKEKMSSSFNKKEKIMIKTTNNKEEILSQKLALPKLNEKQLLNHFKMLNDSFSEHSANLTEKSNSNTEEAINIISEQDMGQIDFEVNNNIIKYKKEKEKEYLSSIKNLEASMIEKEKIIQNNNENNVEKLKEKLAILKEKWQNEKKKYLENLRAGAEIKFDQKIKKEIENFNDLKKIGESNIKIKNKEILECLEDKHKNEINYKKSKVLMRKHEFEKNKIMKKKINEKKAKFLLNKIKDEEKPEIEKEFKENLQIFQEAEMEKKKLTLNSFISKMQEEYQNLLYVNKIY